MSPLPQEPPAGEITPEGLYSRRREFLKNAALFAGTSAAMGTGLLRLLGGPRAKKAAASPPGFPPHPGEPVATPDLPASLYTAADPRTPYEDITTYNNYYELGLHKNDPS